MPDSVLVNAVVTIGFGALAGGITNAVAVWMLFHPYQPRGIGPFRIQGAIPKNHPRLAKAIGRTVGERLLPPADLASQLNAPEFRAAFDRALAGVLESTLEREWGPPRKELPAALVREIEAGLQPLAETLAERLATYIASDEFNRVLGRHVTLEAWVEQAASSEELERAVRGFVAAQRRRLETDQTPLLDRLPSGLVHAVQQGVADYLPLAVERLADVLSDPEARDRLRTALKRFLDRAIRNLMVHERLVAKLVVTERTIDRVLASMEDDRLGGLLDALEAPDFRSQVARAVNDAVVRFLRTPLADRFRALGAERLDGLERAAGDYILAALRDPRTQQWAVQRGHTVIALGRKALIEEGGKAWIAGTAARAIEALLDRPVGRPGRLMPPNANARLQHALSEPLWSWLQAQVPIVVSQLSIPEMVEQKLLGFSVEKMEALVRRVTQKELNLIVYLGYVLGGIVGAGAFLVGQLLRG